MSRSDGSVATDKGGELTGVIVRPMEEGDVDAADEVMRMAFGTYLGAPEPMQVFGDSDHVHTRFQADPSRAFCAELDGEVIGSNFATRWGSFGFFGPLTVRVDHWDKGIASLLMEPVMDLFEQWGVRQSGLFTFPESPKHVSLYQKFGFWPQELTPLLQKSVGPEARSAGYSTYGEARGQGNDQDALAECRDLANGVFAGLDLGDEIVATDANGFGETVLVHEDDQLAGFAVCHGGPGTEAGTGACFIKFGAAKHGDGAEEGFERMLDACEAWAVDRGLERVVAGCNTARRDACGALLDRGYSPFLNGLAMLRPGGPGYNRPDAWVIDDLR